MAIWLKQSTASQEVTIGRFVDSGDGNTEETGLTIANTDIKLHKAGATTLASKNSGGATHIANGLYYIVLDATDTDTLGNLVIYCHPTGALAVQKECIVLPANVYDSMVSGTDYLQVDTYQINGSQAAAVRQALAAGVMVPGTVDTTAVSTTTTTFESDDITEATADHYNGRVVIFTSGALLGQQALINDYSLNGGRGAFTVSTMTEAPTNNDTFIII